MPQFGPAAHVGGIARTGIAFMYAILEVAVVDLLGNSLNSLCEDALRYFHPIEIVGIGCFHHWGTEFAIFWRQAAEEPVQVSIESASNKQSVGLVAVLNSGKESELAENPHGFCLSFSGLIYHYVRVFSTVIPVFPHSSINRRNKVFPMLHPASRCHEFVQWYTFV
jgi:hypothetical protein